MTFVASQESTLLLGAFVPITDCKTDQPSATITTSYANQTFHPGIIPVQRDPSLFRQSGAPSYEIRAKEPGVLLSGPYKNGEDLPDDFVKIFKLSGDNSTLTIQVPNPPFTTSFAFAISAGNPTRAGPTAIAGSGTALHLATITLGPYLTRAGNASKSDQAGGKDSIELAIWEKVGCDPEAGMTVNPQEIASMCVNNSVQAASLDVWKKYDAPRYMFNLLTKAQVSVGGQPVNGAEVIHKDVNAAGPVCIPDETECTNAACSSLLNPASGTPTSIAQSLAYNAVVNLNRFLAEARRAALDAGLLASFDTAKIVNDFFQEKQPQASIAQIFGIIGPLLGMLSAIAAPLAAASAGLGVLSGAVGAAGGISAMTGLQAMVEQSFNLDADLLSHIGDYLRQTLDGIQPGMRATPLLYMFLMGEV